MSESLKAKWRSQMPEKPIDSCGRLDMDTHLCEPATVGRVTSDRVRYVYFADGEECIVLGEWCDFVAFRAADYDTIVSDNERLRVDIERLADELERHRMTEEERVAMEAARDFLRTSRVDLVPLIAGVLRNYLDRTAQKEVGRE